MYIKLLFRFCFEGKKAKDNRVKAKKKKRKKNGTPGIVARLVTNDRSKRPKKMFSGKFLNEFSSGKMSSNRRGSVLNGMVWHVNECRVCSSVCFEEWQVVWHSMYRYRIDKNAVQFRWRWWRTVLRSHRNVMLFFHHTFYLVLSLQWNGHKKFLSFFLLLLLLWLLSFFLP